MVSFLTVITVRFFSLLFYPAKSPLFSIRFEGIEK